MAGSGSHLRHNESGSRVESGTNPKAKPALISFRLASPSAAVPRTLVYIIVYF